MFDRYDDLRAAVYQTLDGGTYMEVDLPTQEEAKRLYWRLHQFKSREIRSERTDPRVSERLMRTVIKRDGTRILVGQAHLFDDVEGSVTFKEVGK